MCVCVSVSVCLSVCASVHLCVSATVGLCCNCACVVSMFLCLCLSLSLGKQGAIEQEAFKATSIPFYWRSRLPFARLQTLQNPLKALLATLTPQANAPRPHQQLFLGRQGAINSFLLAFKPAVCHASNRTKPPKTPQNQKK